MGTLQAYQRASWIVAALALAAGLVALVLLVPRRSGASVIAAASAAPSRP
jgi:hypothetical protein